MRLEKLVRDVLPSFTEEIIPVYRSVSVPVQISMSCRQLSPKERANFMGLFYECMTRALYGGKLNDLDYEVNWRNGERVSGTVRPDIINHKDGIAQDSKACCSGSECVISLKQFEGYRFLQSSNPDFQYLFPIYRHGLKGIKSAPTEGFTEKGIVLELARKTFHSVVLPLSVLIKMKEIPYVGGLNISRITETKNWRTSLNLKSSVINRFLFDPKGVLGIIGLNSEEFEIQRYRSPEELKICGVRIRPFPILRILNRDNSGWAEKFIFDYERELEREAGYRDTDDVPLFEESKDVPF